VNSIVPFYKNENGFIRSKIGKRKRSIRRTNNQQTRMEKIINLANISESDDDETGGIAPPFLVAARRRQRAAEEMNIFTRADLDSDRDAYAREKMREYVKASVKNIYSGVRKTAVERSDHSFYYNVHEQTHIDVITLAEAIQAKLQVLFPDFKISIGDVNNGDNSSRYICVKW
jgi:hypothetical protein